MFSEYDDFMEYIDMYEDCKDPSHKVELKKIAEDEMHHYKHIYDLVFPKTSVEGMTETWTPIEKGIYDYASHLYHKMSEKFSKLK